MNSLKLDTNLITHVEGGVREIRIMAPSPVMNADPHEMSGAPGGPGGRAMEAEVPEHYKYEGVCYIGNVVDPKRQRMNICFPAAYMDGGTVNGYTAKTAPVLFFVPGGGFRMHGLMDPALDELGLMALKRGFVVAAPDIRGCEDCYVDVDGDGEPEFTGTAPAQLVDLKAALRFLRYNQDVLPGNFSRVVATGGSSGGAMTSLLAASGNTPRIKKYLEQAGAADAPDDIQAAIPFCGPGDLIHADMAYDWIFGRFIYEADMVEAKNMWGIVEASPVIGKDENGNPIMRINYSAGETAYDYYTVYAKMFVDEYLKGELGVTEAQYVARFMGYLLPAYLKHRANNPGECENDYFFFDSYEAYLAAGNPKDPYYDECAYPAGGYINFDLFRASTAKAAFKGSPSFDKLKKSDMLKYENALFGDLKSGGCNFTAYGAAHSDLGLGVLPGDVAERVVNQNPLSYIGDPECDCAKHWIVGHGTWDGDIPVTLSMDIVEKLKATGVTDVDFWLVVNGGHGGGEGEAAKSRMLDWAERALFEI